MEDKLEQLLTEMEEKVKSDLFSLTEQQRGVACLLGVVTGELLVLHGVAPEDMIAALEHLLRANKAVQEYTLVLEQATAVVH